MGGGQEMSGEENLLRYTLFSFFENAIMIANICMQIKSSKPYNMANRETSDGGPLSLPGSGIVHSCALYSGQDSRHLYISVSAIKDEASITFMIARNVPSPIII